MSRVPLLLCPMLLCLGCDAPPSTPGPNISTQETRAAARRAAANAPQPTLRPAHALRHLSERDASASAVPALGSDALVTRGDRAFLTDTAGDAIYLVDTAAAKLLARHSTPTGAHPGRLAVGMGRVFVALRATGEVLALDAADLTPQTQRSVCPAPRGVAYDAERERVWVSCASGELVSLEPDTLDVTTKTHLDADLRDVVATEDGVFVSRFRAAEVLSIDPDTGKERERIHVHGTLAPGHALWKMDAAPWGNLVVSFQQAIDVPLEVSQQATPGGYASRRCDAPGVTAQSALVRVTAGGSLDQARHLTQCEPSSALPLDIAWRPCGEPAMFHGASVPARRTEARPAYSSAATYNGSKCSQASALIPADAQLLAAGFNERNEALLVTRDRELTLRIRRLDEEKKVTLHSTPPFDMGQYLFHSSTGNGIACASCHLEGGDDGRVWRFAKENTETARRTQNLRGGVEGRLHWDGEFEDIDELMRDVFTTRMGGFSLGAQDARALHSWLQTLPPDPGMTLTDEGQDASRRGAALYEQAGCDTCHGGVAKTDHAFADVGTGGVFKTPSLRGVSQRHRLMHDGCAQNLLERFEPRCGGEQHGDLGGMSPEDLLDLSAYLQTL